MRSCVESSLAIADVKGVQKQIAVGEHRPFRKAGRARSVLDVDRIAGREFVFAICELLWFNIISFG